MTSILREKKSVTSNQWWSESVSGMSHPSVWRGGGYAWASYLPFFLLDSPYINTMSLRLIASTKSVLQQQTIVKVQASRFGTLSLTNALFNNSSLTSDSISRNTFEIPSWLEPILWAAPKKKTSHSKKRMRASNKGLQQKENVTTCPACGSNKLLHHLCGNCYSDIKKKAKSEVAIDA